MCHFSKYFQLENGPLTELSMDDLHRALESYQPSTRDYSESTFKVDPVNADANLGVGTSEHQISNAPEESGQMSNMLRCPWLVKDETTKKICGNIVPAEIRAILDHLSSEHDVRGGEKRLIVCGWATDSGVCGRSFQRRHAKRHVESHLGLRYLCQHCSKKFARADLLRDHVRNEHQV